MYVQGSRCCIKRGTMPPRPPDNLIRAPASRPHGQFPKSQPHGQQPVPASARQRQSRPQQNAWEQKGPCENGQETAGLRAYNRYLCDCQRETSPHRSHRPAYASLSVHPNSVFPRRQGQHRHPTPYCAPRIPHRTRSKSVHTNCSGRPHEKCAVLPPPPPTTRRCPYCPRQSPADGCRASSHL